VNVQLPPPGSQFQLAIEVANISRFAQAVVVQVRTLDFRRLSGTLAMLGVPLRHGLIETGRGMPLRARLSEESSFLRESSPGRRRGRPAQRATASRPSAGLVAELSAQFAPSEHRQLLLSGTVPREARRARRSASR